MLYYHSMPIHNLFMLLIYCIIGVSVSIILISFFKKYETQLKKEIIATTIFFSSLSILLILICNVLLTNSSRVMIACTNISPYAINKRNLENNQNTLYEKSYKKLYKESSIKEKKTLIFKDKTKQFYLDKSKNDELYVSINNRRYMEDKISKNMIVIHNLKNINKAKYAYITKYSYDVTFTKNNSADQDLKYWLQYNPNNNVYTVTDIYFK